MALPDHVRAARELGFRLRTAVILMLTSVGATVFESLGISILMPAFQYINADGDMAALTADSRLWQRIDGAYGLLGIRVDLLVLLLTSFLLILMRQSAIYIQLLYTAAVRRRITRDVRDDGFTRYLHADLSYQEHHRRGDLINILTTDLNRATLTVFSSLLVLGQAIQVLAYIAILVFLSPPATAMILVTIGVSLFLLRNLLRRSRSVGNEITRANLDLSSFLVSRLNAARLVRISGAERVETSNMHRLTERHARTSFRADLLRANVATIIEPLIFAGGLVLLYIGTAHLALDITHLGLFLIVIVRLTPVIKTSMGQAQKVLDHLGSLQSVTRRLRDMAAACEPVGGHRRLGRLTDGVRLEDVTFRHWGDQAVPALKGVSLEIPAGKLTALVGPSGSGKSTLVDLLPRLRRPTAGRILIDHHPIHEYEVASLRSAIAYAPQSPPIFETTPRAHIRYDRPDASDQEILEAAHLTGAHEFIAALPNGYDTEFGEGGIRLSGGQRQRLDLARALVKDAPLLILDEPTSDLDADSAHAFRETLLRIREEAGITILTIGHQLSSISCADRIIVLDRGRVAEVGTHDDLVHRDGWYAQAFAKQQVRSAANPSRETAGANLEGAATPAIPSACGRANGR